MKKTLILFLCFISHAVADRYDCVTGGKVARIEVVSESKIVLFNGRPYPLEEQWEKALGGSFGHYFPPYALLVYDGGKAMMVDKQQGELTEMQCQLL